jgi:hypothetical protein
MRADLRKLMASGGFVVMLAAMSACAAVWPFYFGDKPISSADRLDILKRAQVWRKTNVAAMDILTGPTGPGSFARNAEVRCDYTDKQPGGGRSPKFLCVIPGKEPDEVKVKYGLNNAEVFGEVLASRLLWALGFGADRMYPVRVICTGCPPEIVPERRLPSGESVFDPAVIERKTRGREVESRPDEGWSWQELDLVDPEAGGAPRAHRDALKLLAVFMQHSDSKPAQQRLVCLDPEEPESSKEDCARPFMLMQDVGLTFGKTDLFYRKKNYVNLRRWSSARIWGDRDHCIGNLNRPVLGTLQRPLIGEPGRRFLADLLNQLTDKQIRDLFEVARINRRADSPNQAGEPRAGADQWVAAFKAKRQEINARSCKPVADPAR